MVDEDALQQRRHPQVLLLVDGYGEHRRVVDDAVQVVVAAAELLLIVIVGKESLVVGAQPDVVP